MLNVTSAAALYHCPCEPSTSYKPVTVSSSTSPSTTPSPPVNTQIGQRLAYHPLSELYFCEECDCIRCQRCVLEEVASYYCPNCLFEVPSASVRAERNRCARNCFLCPCCTNTLSIVLSDPTDPSVVQQPSTAQASVGEPPHYLACMSCRWDSKSVGITFEKSTGLAAQLQKLDDASPHHLEYDHIRDHIEPYLKSGLAAAQPMSSNTLGRLPSHLHPSSKRPTPTSAIAAAARALTSSSSTVLRDIPSSISSASRFNSLHNLAMKASSNPSSASKYGGGGNLPSTEDTLKAYQSLSIKGKGREMLKPDVYEKERLQKSRELDAMEDIPRRSARAPSQLWSIPWQPPLLEEELRPLRIPLKSKKTKRCHACRHIVVKPDTKAATVKYKIRLMASSYVPSIDVHRRIPPSLAGRLSAVGSQAPSAANAATSRRSSARTVASRSSAVESLVQVGGPDDIEPLRPGRNYTFHLTFVNPLWESIEVFVEVAEPSDEESEADEDDDKGVETSNADDATAQQGRAAEQLDSRSAPLHNAEKRKPYQVSILAKKFKINAYAEAWEYEGLDDDADDLQGLPEAASSGIDGSEGGSTVTRRRRHGPAVLAQKGNKTVIQLDLVTGREASGILRVPLYLTFTYTAEPESPAKDAAGNDKTQGGTGTTNDGKADNQKTFSFWTSVLLGNVVPRPVAAPSKGASAAPAPNPPPASPAAAAAAEPNTETSSSLAQGTVPGAAS